MERVVFNPKECDVSRVTSFGYYRYKNAQPSLENHIHKDVLEICFCVSGRQRYVVEEKLLVLKGNDILIVPSDTKHSSGNYPEDKGELFWIQISLEKSLGKLCHLPHEQSEYLLQSLSKKSNYIFKGSYHLKPILEQLLVELKGNSDILSKLSINQLILQLLLQTLQFSQSEQHTKRSDRMKAIDEFIRNNQHRIVFVDELAELTKTSLGYFKVWFKEKAGMPPKEYINRLKIEQAKIDLLEKSSVTQTAFDLGFNSSQYFATVFKKFTGQTPKMYISSRNFTH